MQLSRFSLMVSDYPETGEHLIYNTRTQSLVKIEDDFKKLLEHLPEYAVAPRSYESQIKELHRLGVIVRDDADDSERLHQFMERKKYGIDTSQFCASILTTYSCNFACTYCFEESTRETAQKLNRSTSLTAMAWMQKKLLKYGMKTLLINFYGGEPLLNKPEIEFIAQTMKDWCAEHGIGFSFMLQTNGALMTQELVHEYKKLGLVKAKISLDGTKEVHDKQRPMRGSGVGTFDTVIKNIVDAVDLIKVSLAAGYDNGDPATILKLVDYLDNIGILRKLENFTWTPIHPGLGPTGHPDKLVGSSCMSNYQTDTLLAAEKAIKEAVIKKGLPIRSGLNVSMCPVTTGDSNITIDTQGNIFKCNAMLGHTELAVGSIYEEEYNAKQKEYMDADNWKKCESDCPYAPICNTGCRLFAFFKTQDFSAKSCEKEYMDKFVMRGIKLEYQKRLQRNEIKKEIAAISG